MKIVAVEINHEKHSVDILSKFAMNESELIVLMKELGHYVKESFIISTCNRLAIYAYADNVEVLINFFKHQKDMAGAFEVFDHSEPAALHLFSTAAGLKSQVIGEHEILGQVKSAGELARKSGTLGPVLDEFLRESIRIGKLVRNSSGIGQRAISTASVGIELIEKNLGDLSGSEILVIGTGQISKVVLEILKKKKVKHLYVASHSFLRAKESAEKANATPILIDQIDNYFGRMDIVVGCTHQEVAFWDESLLEGNICPRHFMALLNDKPRLFLDLGMPRNFNPMLRRDENIVLYDLDDVKVVSNQNIEKRISLLPTAKKKVVKEVGFYLKKLRHRVNSPLYAKYWNELECQKESGLHWLKPKLKNIDNKDWEMIERWAHKMIRSISQEPLKKMRGFVEDNSVENNGMDLLDLLFGDGQVLSQKEINSTEGSGKSVAFYKQKQA